MSYEALQDERDNEKGVMVSMVELVPKSKWCIEFKTTSEDVSLGSNYWKKLSLDGQVSSYLAAFPELAGCVYCVVRKTKLEPLLATPEEKRRYTKAGKLDARQRDHDETEQEYLERIVADIAEDPTKYYARGIITRTEKEIQDYERDQMGTAAMITFARKHNVWPRQVGSCFSYNRACEYWDVCANGADINDPALYTTRSHMARGLPVLSPSAVSVWRACPKKYFFAHELRKRRVSDEAHALWFGKQWHTVIQAYHSPRAGFGSDALERGLYRVEKMEPGYDRAHAKALLLGYEAMYAKQPFELSDVEVNFTRPLTDPDTGRESTNFQNGGFLDGIAEMTP